MSDLSLEFDLPGEPAAAYAALTTPMILRCWYGAPPGWHRVGAGGALTDGQLLVLTLRDAQGASRRHGIGIQSQEPDRRVELRLGWDGGPLAGRDTLAVLTFAPGAAGTRVTVAHGALGGPEQVEAAEACWRASFARLATLLAGGAVSPYEELANELHAFHDPLGVALFGVLAGLREAGAPAAVVAQVEAIATEHLPRLSAETGDLLDGLMRERLAVIDGWRLAPAPAAAAETPA